MTLTNTRQAYGWGSIALHWIAAFSILALYLTGEALEEAVGRPARMAAMGQHISLGLVLTVFLVLRVLWYLFNRRPDPLPQHPALGLLSSLVHWLLLIDIVVLVVTGPLPIWAFARPVSVYGWFEIPSPFPAPNRDLHELSETIHGWAAHAVLPLVALHVLGALKHLIVNRDRTLQRMLWVRRPTAEG